MIKKLLFCLLALAFVVPPAAAQDASGEGVSPLIWIPSDYEGFVRVDMRSPGDTLNELNLASYIAAFVQRQRSIYDRRKVFADFFPLDILDTENVTFEAQILPWLDSEIVLAYRQFDARFGVSPEDALLILPTEQPFVAATFLSTVAQSQDFPARETYRDTVIYSGDLTAIAFTPVAVLIGTTDTLHEALDTGFGGTSRLMDSDVFSAVDSVTAEGGMALAYFNGEAAANALSVALQGSTSAQPLLAAMGEAMASYDAGVLEQALLRGDVDSLSIRLEVNTFSRVLRATATIHTAADVDLPVADAVFNPAVLEMIPRSAMVVQAGGDGRTAFYDTVLTLPMSSFVTNLVGAFFFDPATTLIPEPPNAPDAQDIADAVSGFERALSLISDFDLNEDLVAHLDGSYAFALLPRPNNPAPLTGVRYDLLLIAEVDDGEAALEGALELARAVLALEADDFDAAEIEGATIQTVFVTPINEPIVQLGAVENRLLVGTGSAIQQAMRAGRGDNRLTDTQRWQNVNRDSKAGLYVDLNAVYNTFIPTAGSPVLQGIGQLSASAQYLGEGIFQLDLVVNVPLPA